MINLKNVKIETKYVEWNGEDKISVAIRFTHDGREYGYHPKSLNVNDTNKGLQISKGFNKFLSEYGLA